MQEHSYFYDWIKRRHISDAIIEEFNIHVGNHDPIGNCIVIPVVDEKGVFTFNKYRRDPQSQASPKYLYDKGGHVTLYGFFKAKNEPRIIITEGEMDALVAWSSNIPAVTSTGGANSFQKEWASLFVDKEVIICFDNDSAGGAGMVKTLDILPHAKVLFLPDRPGIKDISDYVSNGGDLHELLRHALSFPDIQSVIDDRSRRLSLWQSTFFHDAYIAYHTIPSYASRAPEHADSVTKAKSFPIPQIITLKGRKALCLWHNERHASMQYYPATNTVYCFSCGKHGDSIDVYRKVHDCSFAEAIKKLS